MLNSYKYEDFEKKVREILLINIDDHIEKCNLFEVGLNSLQIMRIINILKQKGIKVTFAELIENPYLEKWWEILQKKLEMKDTVLVETKKESSETKSNILTDVQHAYWVGRGEKQILGGVSCHAYFEFRGFGVDLGRLRDAWDLIQNRHPMLRAKFMLDGKQQIIEKGLLKNELIVHDLSDGKFDVEEYLQKHRDTNSHRVFKVEDGQVSKLEITFLDNNSSIIHFDIDLLVADLKSIKIILDDLVSAYNGVQLPKLLESAEFLRNIKTSKALNYDEDKAYWSSRIGEMPGMPQLPVSKNINNIEHPIFKRRNFWMDEDKWKGLLELSAKKHVTPAMFLLALYVEVIGKYSNSSKFVINVPLFGRPFDVEGIENVVGDFTNILLLPIDISISSDFIERVQSITDAFTNAMKHNAYSGIEIIRELMREKGGKIIAPVVFSCSYDEPMISATFESYLGKLNYISTQTPQVLIDFQIIKLANGVMFSWDVVDEVFYDGFIDEMFESYTSLLVRLIDQPEIWNEKLDFPKSQSFVKRYQNIHTFENTRGCIHDKVFLNMKRIPNHVAVIEANTGTSLTYQQLHNAVENLVNVLICNGLTENDKVGVYLPKGSDQIVAVLAVLEIGACYVPVGVNQPLQRVNRMILKSGIKVIISDVGGKNYLKDKIYQRIVAVNDSAEKTFIHKTVEDPDKSSYIIFTSGTTGEPKGVEILHKNAWNTINEVNRICNIDGDSKILSVSALEFDLSVYDIFGVLSQGGTIILVGEDAKRDALIWVKAIKDYKVTVWNSVPYLLNMLLAVAEMEKDTFLSLKTVLLSGDWIGLDLPERLKKVAPNAEIIAMGGATEAAIWSNYIKVKFPLPSNWTSIPYGKPLIGQLYRVVDWNGQDCPDWVTGELWIGGDGVAKGYIGDDDLTKEKFVYDGKTTWYKTGDMGRFWPDGTIEFLGRKDTQIKIRGHRIELGEIESVLHQHTQISDCVISVVNDRGSKKLYAYIIPEQANLDVDEVGIFLKSYLPDYMIPSRFVIGEKMPLSVNGKIDRRQVNKILEQNVNMELANFEAPTGKIENAVAAIWREVLKIEKLSRNDDFFEIGGDSLKAVTIMSQMKQKKLIPLDMSVQILFATSTIKNLAEYLNSLVIDESQETEIDII